MKQLNRKATRAFLSQGSKAVTKTAAFFLLVFTFNASSSNAQHAVAGIVTDYNGFWKTRTGAFNNVKPVNSHNMLAFTYNNKQYSTGVNDGVLTAKGETFVAGDFWALP